MSSETQLKNSNVKITSCTKEDSGVLIGVRFSSPEEYKAYIERLEPINPGFPVLLNTWVLEDKDGSIVAVFKVIEDRKVIERALSVYKTLKPVFILDSIDGYRFRLGPDTGVECPYELDFKGFLNLLSLIGYSTAAGLREIERQQEVSIKPEPKPERRNVPVKETVLEPNTEEEYSSEEINAVKRWIAEDYLDAFSGYQRRILEEIVDRLTIDPKNRRISLGSKEAEFGSLGEVRSAVLTILYEYRDRLGESFDKAVDAIAGIVIDTVSTIAKPTPQVVIKNISEREELADQLYQLALQKLIIKTFRVGDNILGIYCHNDGVYEECESEVERVLWVMVKDKPNLRKKAVRWVINEALARIRRETIHDLRYEPKKIAFKNVIFDWEKFIETGSIRAAVEPFNPETIVFHKIPHKLALEKLELLEGLLKYDERLAVINIEELAAKLCPKALKVFKEWVGDKWILLFEIIGYTLYPEYILHKAVMAVGDGSNGKSTYLKLIKTILGSKNVVSIPLQHLTDPEHRFAAAQLYRKLANIYADLPNLALKETGIFKILTGEDDITADRKFRDPITFRNYAKMIFSANELPEVRDMTFAFWRRWIVIEFPNKFPEDPTFFERTFTEDEIEGIIIVSLYAFRNVYLRRKFSFEESPEDYKRIWLRKSNSVYAFIDDLINGNVPGCTAKLDPEGVVEKDTLYNLYVQYCSNEDYAPVDKKVFTQELERLFSIRTHGRGRKFYKGIRLECENNRQSKLLPD